MACLSSANTRLRSACWGLLGLLVGTTERERKVGGCSCVSGHTRPQVSGALEPQFRPPVAGKLAMGTDFPPFPARSVL